MTDITDNTSRYDGLPIDETHTANDEQKASHSAHSDSEHHHHHSDGEHHHHHSDGEHHHHHSDGEHHHHHHRSESKNKRHSSSKKSYYSNIKKRSMSFRGIKKSLKRFFLKMFSNEQNKSETEKTRLIKRAIFLILMFVIFSFTFYILILDNINGSDMAKAKNSPSDADLLRRQISQLQSDVQKLQKELQIYKDTFGELDLSNIKE